jgi:DNA-binding FadR family transcriptional regulator
LKPINVPSAPQAAAEALRNAIIAGDIKPGERLLEHKLAARLGIGQPTLREAFKELEYQGFLRKGPQRGTYVTKLSKDDFRKILEVRLALEVVGWSTRGRGQMRQAATRCDMFRLNRVSARATSRVLGEMSTSQALQ